MNWPLNYVYSTYEYNGMWEWLQKIIKEDEEREDDDTLDESKQITDLTEWRSTYQSDAGFFTQATRPATIQELYNNCEKVPELEKLQVLHLHVLLTLTLN